MSDREEESINSPRQEKKEKKQGKQEDKNTSIVTDSGKSDSKEVAPPVSPQVQKTAVKSPVQKSRDRPKASASPRRPASQGDGKKKQKEFFKEELNRLKKSLKKESEKITKPPIKEHIPYVFNTLEPYYNVSNAKYLIEVPQEARQPYVSRQTAISLCDPWDNHRMDRETYLPRVDSAKAVINTEQTKRSLRSTGSRGRPTTKGDQKERPPKEGSTRLPKFPSVRIPAEELSRKTLYYNDVPALRNELKKKYSSSAGEKVRDDYMRTKQDFFRMELDRMEYYHPSSRPKMKSTYYAYLQNTPGSRRAITECVESLDKDGPMSPRAESSRKPTQQAAS